MRNWTCRASLYAGFALTLSGCAAAPRAQPRAAAAGKAPIPVRAAKPSELWRRAEASGEPAAYLAFLQAVPASDSKAAKARDACRRLLLQGKGGEDDAAALLRLIPEGPAASEIRAELKKRRFESAKSSPDPGAAALFADLYPGEPEAESLAPAVRSREYQRLAGLGTRAAYRFFLERFPSSPESDQARSRLAAFEAQAPSPGDPGDLELLPRLRRARPALERLECAAVLRASLSREKDLFGAGAEEARGRLIRLAAARSLPDFCAGRQGPVPARARSAVANAVHALSLLQERRQAFAAETSASERLLSDARDIGGRAAALADAAEAQDLELEALYGGMPADPKRPDDTATKNAREALRRAKRAFDAARGAGGKARKGGAGEVLSAMDRQADLLLEIIAARENPAAPEQVQAGGVE